MDIPYKTLSLIQSKIANFKISQQISASFSNEMPLKEKTNQKYCSNDYLEGSQMKRSLCRDFSEIQTKKENKSSTFFKGLMTQSVHEEYLKDKQKIRRLGSKDKRRNRIKTQTAHFNTFQDENDISETELAQSSSCHIDQYLGKGKGIEIKVMQPNTLKSAQKITKHKSSKFKNSSLYSDFSKTKERVSRKFMKEKPSTKFIQQKIQLKDILNPQRTRKQSQTKTIVKIPQERGNFKSIINHQQIKNERKASSSKYWDQFCEKKVKRERSESNLKRVQRNQENSNKKENEKKSVVYRFQNEKLLKKMDELKEINFIQQNLAELQIEAILNQLEIGGIPEARWSLFIVDRVYQKLKTKEYREGMKQITRQY